MTWWMDDVFGENVINLVTIESKGVNHSGSKFNVAAFVSEDAEVTATDSNIALCTIRCEFNRKSKCRSETGNT